MEPFNNLISHQNKQLFNSLIMGVNVVVHASGKSVLPRTVVTTTSRKISHDRVTKRIQEKRTDMRAVKKEKRGENKSWRGCEHATLKAAAAAAMRLENDGGAAASISEAGKRKKSAYVGGGGGGVSYADATRERSQKRESASLRTVRARLSRKGPFKIRRLTARFTFKLQRTTFKKTCSRATRIGQLNF